MNRLHPSQRLAEIVGDYNDSAAFGRRERLDLRDSTGAVLSRADQGHMEDAADLLANALRVGGLSSTMFHGMLQRADDDLRRLLSDLERDPQLLAEIDVPRELRGIADDEVRKRAEAIYTEMFEL